MLPWGNPPCLMQASGQLSHNPSQGCGKVVVVVVVETASGNRLHEHFQIWLCWYAHGWHQFMCDSLFSLCLCRSSERCGAVCGPRAPSEGSGSARAGGLRSARAGALRPERRTCDQHQRDVGESCAERSLLWLIQDESQEYNL